VIDAELNRDHHGSILCNCDRRGLEPLDARTDLPNQNKPVVKEKKNNSTFDLYSYILLLSLQICLRRVEEKKNNNFYGALKRYRLYEYFISVGYRFKECWSKGKKK
jgi:hypothetical protein